MNFNQRFQKIAVLFVFLSNLKPLLFINKLVFIEKSVWNDRHVDLFILVINLAIIIIIILMMYFKEAERTDEIKSSDNFLFIVLHHIGCKSAQIVFDGIQCYLKPRQSILLLLSQDTSACK